MRFLRVKSVDGLNADEVLAEFTERADEFGFVAESDLVSVTVTEPPAGPIPMIHDPKRGSVRPTCRVTVVYWTDERE
jgi:hypothetical protein